MTPYYQDDSVQIFLGDCREILPTLVEPVDLVLTDPPYGLKFMGKEWDHGVPGVIYWQAISRAAKPGAHLFAFGGTRTFHRLTCAIEDAGFEIRDCMMWLYGSGFPKSLDVSKAIDKKRDDLPDIERVRQWLEQKRAIAGMTRKDVNAALGLASNGGGLMSSWTTNQTTVCVPQWEQWLELKRLLRFGDEMDAEVWRLNGRKGTPGEAWNQREIIEEREVLDIRNGHGRAYGSAMFAGEKTGKIRNDITAPATDAAQHWAGWGTALKPAWEPIIIAKKPVEGTVAANVQKWGTGALNIDGCRIETEDDRGRAQGHDIRGGAFVGSVRRSTLVTESHPAGRWPANLILDEEAAALLDEQSGLLTSGANPERRGSDKFRGIFAAFPGQSECAPARGADAGGASRFFYTAKASGSDRGNKDFAELPLLGIEATEFRNTHPTVKPTSLIKYLITLASREGQTILDPFAGSFTTAVVAKALGRKCIAIELEEKSCEIGAKRLNFGA